MTVQTKRRVIVCGVALLLTLPTESILLKALQAPTQAQAATQYAQSLTPSQLASAASSIQTYPVAYRRAIMTALPATMRAQTWQNHLQAFLAANPNLDAATEQAMQSAIALITPDLLSRPATSVERDEIHRIAGQVSASLGTDTALNLFYNLGPADGTFSSSVPISNRIADYLRRSYLHAGSSNCDCSTSWGCNSGGTCDGSTGCNVQTGWPACGWLWQDPCDGQCNTASH